MNLIMGTSWNFRWIQC